MSSCTRDESPKIAGAKVEHHLILFKRFWYKIGIILGAGGCEGSQVIIKLMQFKLFFVILRNHHSIRRSQIELNSCMADNFLCVF